MQNLNLIRERCTAETDGTIIRSWQSGENTEYVRVTVQYIVGTKAYQISEHLTNTVKKVKLFGILPIAAIKEPSIRQCKVGDKPAVIYDPEEPECACLKENLGGWN